MRLLGCSLALLFGLGSGVIIYLIWAQSEGAYAGRSLESWLQFYQTLDDAESPVAAQEARQAILTIGTNSLPRLVERLAYDPVNRRRRVVAVTRTLPGPIRRSSLVRPLMVDRDEFRADAAAKALRILGPAATPAMAQLAGLARQTNSLIVSRRAISVLARMEKNGLAPLEAIISDVKHPNRLFAIDYLSDLGSNALPAVPSLIRLLADQSPPIRDRATNTLVSIAPQAIGRAPVKRPGN